MIDQCLHRPNVAVLVDEVRAHDELFALPMATVEGVARLTRTEIQRHLDEEPATFDYGGQ